MYCKSCKVNQLLCYCIYFHGIIVPLIKRV